MLLKKDQFISSYPRIPVLLSNLLSIENNFYSDNIINHIFGDFLKFLPTTEIYKNTLPFMQLKVVVVKRLNNNCQSCFNSPSCVMYFFKFCIFGILVSYLSYDK